MSGDDERNAKQAAIRGFMLKCPSCGVGETLHKYLKVRDKCSHCGIELHHASVDDGPAYFTLMVVVAIIFPLFAVIYSNYDPNPLLVALSLMGAATGLALWLLPRVKGVFLGLQWAARLHGF
ncbi:DUF983 domain-containing protein [Primorskyibacter aestuariivivens]|uniref:DUF983 domain-containing protein n=1 Tax=Primorskyibacter aestuariivivens TaxID=1888912 RepID=UPI002300F24E|nr:DUF983 domain-containing protein [Primorskyibacter aestuariivivens]MDA7427463.1 DUF983 domain-containing protein [Primorskyibacter aestuariivivens]